MSKVTELLARLSKAVDTLKAPEDESAQVEEFLAYATDQIEKAAKEPQEKRVPRLKHLKGQIDAIAKNFEGPTPGKVTIQQYQDPAQSTHTSGEQNPSTGTQNGPTNFATNETQPQAAVGSTPTGGEVPPIVAPGSGVSTAEAATFAKALTGLSSAIAKMMDAPAAPPADPAVVPPTTTPAASATIADPETTPPAVSTDAAPVAKSADPKDPLFWPLDMNSPHGRGEAESPEPEWGFDAGSAAAESVAKRKAAQPAKPVA